MKKRILIFCMLILALIPVSCRKKGRIIPRSTLAEIYAEMFITDQLVYNERVSRRVADTSFVYEPIFNKYGYTTKDYYATMARYIEDPNRYARILKKSALLIETDIKALKQEKKRLEELEKKQDKTALFRPERIFYLTGLENPDLFVEDSLSFFVDSTGGKMYFDMREWLDTAFFGPEMVVRLDSLAAGDTLAVRDTIVAVDSIVKGDKLIAKDPVALEKSLKMKAIDRK